MTVMGAIRLLVGGGLVVAGATLVAPLGERLLVAARQPAAAMTPVTPSPAGPAAARGAQPPFTGSFVPAGGGASATPAAQGIPSSSGAPPLSMTPPSAELPDAAGDSPGSSAASGSDWLQLDRSPPPPPSPLPPPPQELSRMNPAMGAAYRSTLDVPPPPLLDAAAPPPATVWPVVPAAATASAPAPAPIAEVTVPSTYRIRDGDDLGSIAGRLYGHPAAASAIWQANRETIPSPDLLPIGAELRLPPPWAVHARGRVVAGAIEPAAYARAAEVDHAAPSMPADPSPPWLAAVPVAPVSRSTPAAPTTSATVGPQPAMVVVGQGETLASLARRLYGDPAMADMIFAVNRDRLRSPELVVPGMALRLPRPLTAPAP